MPLDPTSLQCQKCQVVIAAGNNEQGYTFTPQSKDQCKEMSKALYEAVIGACPTAPTPHTGGILHPNVEGNPAPDEDTMMDEQTPTAHQPGDWESTGLPRLPRGHGQAQ